MGRSATAARQLAGLVAFVLLTACGGSTNAPAASADPKDCASYVAAYCAHEARCQRQDEATCNAQLGGTTCLSSAQLSTCTDSLFYSVDCQHDPSGCALQEVANRAHEQQVCQDFVAAACAYYQRCGTYPDAASCRAALLSQANIDCAKAVGSSAAVGDCESKLGSASCSAPPSSCANVIAFLGTSS